MKRCTKCDQEKPLEEFASHPKLGKQPYCKECQRLISQNWYRKNKERQKQNAKRNTRLYKHRFQKYKQTLSCEKCGEDESVCLDFHHSGDTSKDFSISNAVCQGLSWNTIMKEIQKCSVLCRNCHAKTHAGIIQAPEARMDRRSASNREYQRVRILPGVPNSKVGPTDGWRR